MKTYLLIVVAGSSLIFSVPGMAKVKTSKLTYEQTIALSSANLINRYKTVGQFLRVFKPHMSAKDYRDFKRALTARSISMSDKLPRIKAKGNVIFIADGGGQIVIKNKSTLMINGNRFRGSQDSAEERFEKIYSKLSKQKKSRVSLENVFVSEAHAFGDLMGIVSVIGAGLGGYYLGPKLGVKSSTGALLGVGGLYLATELWQSFKSGDITCTDDGRYQRRGKSRNTWFMAMEEQSIVASDKVLQAGLEENCTKDNAEALKAWSERDLLTTPAPVVEEQAAPSNAIYGG